MKKKRFSDFAETLHIDSTPKGIYFIFGVKSENFLMGLKIDFKFEIFDLKKGEIFLQSEKMANPFTKWNIIQKRGNLFTKWKKKKSFEFLRKWEIFLQNEKSFKKGEIFLQNEKKEIFWVF